MNLRKLVFQIIEELSGFEITDDTRLDYEYVKDKIIGFNVSLIREHWEKKNSLLPYMRMVDCLQVEKRGIECVINGITFSKKHGCLWTVDFNHLIDAGFDNIAYLGLSDYSQNFTRKSMEGFLTGDAHPYKKNPIYVVVEDIAIFKNLPDNIRALSGSILFEDVTQCCNWPEDDESDFPTPSIQKLTYLIKKDIMASPSADLHNNAQGPINPNPDNNRREQQQE